MNLELFRTPSNLPFFYYTSDNKGGITLEAKVFPIIEIPSLDDLWTTVDPVNFKDVKKHDMGRVVAANVLCTEIARKTRRATGNILFVPNEIEKEWYDINYVPIFNEPNKDPRVMIIVDPSMDSNELRATYWRIVNGKAVDGGIQLSPEGFSCINDVPLYNYEDYFVRGFF